VRKKFLLESLQHSVHALEEENDKLRNAIREHVKDDAEKLLAGCAADGPSVIASDPNNATRTLDDPDYSLVKALQTAQQNFVISDPSVPDNPIVYASQGFLTLTGYMLDQVLGRNCRFLQGPHTNPKSVDKIRQGIEKGEDTTVVLLNYRKDGSTFWNQFFIAALRDGDGNVVNYLGVQCKVSEEYAKAFEKNEEFEDGKK
jgi:PAS domain S-box-containing protein